MASHARPPPGAAPVSDDPFWRSLFETSSYGLQRQAIDRALPDVHDIGEGQSALAVWLGGQAKARDEEELARSRRNGGASRPESPWRLRRAYASDQVGWLPAEALAVLEALVQKGGDPTAMVPGAGMDVLALAFHLDEPAAVRMLLASPNAPSAAQLASRMVTDHKGVHHSWLAWAAHLPHPQLFQALLEHGTDVSEVDREGRTLLFHAHTPEAAAALLARGVSPSALDARGTSVLAHWVNHFVRAGADPPALHNQRDRALLALLTAAPVYLTSREQGPAVFGPLAARAADALASAGETLATARVPDARPWRVAWPVAVYYAKQRLARKSAQSMGPLLELGRTQGWLETPTQATVRGLPDLGWMALVVWSEMGSKGYRAPAVVLDAAARALGAPRSWWHDPSCVDAALRVARRLAKQRGYQEGVRDAWAHWLTEVPHIPVGQWNWAQIVDVARAWGEVESLKNGALWLRPLLSTWENDPAKTMHQRLEWTAWLLEAGAVQQAPRLVAALWEPVDAWPAGEPLELRHDAVLGALAEALPEVAPSVRRVRAQARSFQLDTGLEPPSEPQRQRPRF